MNELNCDDAGAVQSSPTVAEAREKQHCNILIADDEKSVSISISFIVKRLGFAVETVDDGEPALEKIRKSPGGYKLLITDHTMLRMDGLQLVGQLNRLRFPGKILVLTAYLNKDIEDAYKALGVDSIMHKPFDPGLLRDAVRNLIKTD